MNNYTRLNKNICLFSEQRKMQSHSDEENYNGDSLMSHVSDIWFTCFECFTMLAAVESSVGHLCFKNKQRNSHVRKQ